jgi:membrane-associated phospholipid phosphatase
MSRIVLGRHFVGDVLGGALLGFFEYFLMSWMWMDETTTKGLLGWVFHEPAVIEFE